jgi:hypothetical protein
MFYNDKNLDEEDPKEYKSPITGETIKVYPTLNDWERMLKDSGKDGPHWD